MTTATALDWIREMMWSAIVSGAPVILMVTVVGLLLAILQAATQVNDAAVPFTAKAVGVFVALTVSGGWMLGRITEFARHALSAIGHITGG